MLLFEYKRTSAGNQPGVNCTTMANAFDSPSFKQFFDQIISEKLKDAIISYPPNEQYMLKITGQECLITGYNCEDDTEDVFFNILVKDTGSMLVMFPEEICPYTETQH